MNSIWTGFNPFRGKKSDGKSQLAGEYSSISYNAKLKTDQLSDSLFFTQQTLNTNEKWFSIPFHFTFKYQVAQIHQYYAQASAIAVSCTAVIWTREMPMIHQFSWIRSLQIPSVKLHMLINTQLSGHLCNHPKLYGMYLSTNPIRCIAAVRHVITPPVVQHFTWFVGNNARLLRRGCSLSQ